LNAALAQLAPHLPSSSSLASNGLRLEPIEELKCRIVYDRNSIPSEEILRQIVNTLEVRDILIEEESIEEIVKKIYTQGSEALVAPN
jgi:ABC-type uncharacterized transport system ATPase subunit